MIVAPMAALWAEGGPFLLTHFRPLPISEFWFPTEFEYQQTKKALTNKRNKMAMNNMEAARNIAIKVNRQAEILVEVSVCEAIVEHGTGEEKILAKKMLSQRFQDIVSRNNKRQDTDEELLESSSQGGLREPSTVIPRSAHNFPQQSSSTTSPPSLQSVQSTGT